MKIVLQARLKAHLFAILCTAVIIQCILDSQLYISLGINKAAVKLTDVIKVRQHDLAGSRLALG